MTIKTWQSATANNEIHKCEAIQVWEIIFWSSDLQRIAGYTRITQRAFQKCRFLGPNTWSLIHYAWEESQKPVFWKSSLIL